MLRSCDELLSKASYLSHRRRFGELLRDALFARLERLMRSLLSDLRNQQLQSRARHGEQRRHWSEFASA